MKNIHIFKILYAFFQKMEDSILYPKQVGVLDFLGGPGCFISRQQIVSKYL